MHTVPVVFGLASCLTRSTVRRPVRRAWLHSFTLGDGLRREEDAAELHNGMAISEDGKRFFLRIATNIRFILSDSIPKLARSDKESYLRVSRQAWGCPTARRSTRRGFYWCAIHGGSRLYRYTPDGRVDREVLLPVSNPTMCAFGGDDLGTLYVTSASEGLDSAQREAQPLRVPCFGFALALRELHDPTSSAKSTRLRISKAILRSSHSAPFDNLVIIAGDRVLRAFGVSERNAEVMTVTSMRGLRASICSNHEPFGTPLLVA